MLWLVCPLEVPNVHWFGGGQQQNPSGRGAVKLPQGKCNCVLYLWEAAVLFLERLFFYHTQKLRGPSFRYALEPIQWKMRNFIYLHPSSSLTLSLTQSLSRSLSLCLCLCVCVAAAAACLPVCLFLEAHNMADMCFVIVSTTSSLLAYKGRLRSSSSHPKQHGSLKDILAWNQDGYDYTNRAVNEI